ncbi:class I SAM-dependent RNA methyltransferase [Anaeromyxobacter diazotrophicus]|uniref:23S rRNA (Uracil(1939)-C(5))-methyltransferase RlmD n=1 Tax=Anaeromyxobacter diazotrophicus TaxID=2590199 RepID=A0A7I9VS63_9BACT|nr:TRAM domain-containing protein [Anaeromyxobacter diazotrophicus]GEJ59286.1 23S rRNA (uracil(1939)-C(5))-methyltransferase RlmD [Anaeromyxobacter diazotrophicus]
MRTTLDIVDLAPGGEGVGRTGEGRPVFAPFTAPGDRVEVELPGGEGPAHVPPARLLREGPARVAAPCPHFGMSEPLAEAMCGGCEWLHLAYGAQVEAKERAFAETLRRIGRLEAGRYRALPILPSPRPLRYRSRAKFHLDRHTGRLVFFRRRSHDPVQLTGCHLLAEELDALREVAGPALLAARLEAREVTLEWSALDGKGAAFLQLAAITPAARARAEALLAAVPALAGVVLGAEGAPSAAVGDPVLRHARRPGEPAAGRQRSRPDVFQQANRGANALLVASALELLRPDGEEVLELYCGAGNFTGPLAARARHVDAVEGQGPALELARLDAAEAAEAAGARGASRVRFLAGDALAVARGLARERGAASRRYGAALLDPPRQGAPGVGAVLRELDVPRAVYVSCDPATLARDLRACGQVGYTVEAIQPVDMFPQTHHVEAVALLTR